MADVAARAESEGASLLCFPEGFLQGYLTDEMPARRNALDLTSPAFETVLNRLPKTGPMIVIGLIEVEEGRLFNTAIVVDRGVLIGRYRKVHLLSGEHIFDAGSESHLFEVDGLRFGINICYDTNFPQGGAEGSGPRCTLDRVPGQQYAPPKNSKGAQEPAQFRAG